MRVAETGDLVASGTDTNAHGWQVPKYCGRRSQASSDGRFSSSGPFIRRSRPTAGSRLNQPSAAEPSPQSSQAGAPDVLRAVL
jgi:hypothetical protein